MTAEELYQEYKKLNEVESIKFQRMLNIDGRNRLEKLNEMRQNVVDSFNQIKKADGMPYFSEEEIKNKLGL